LPVVFRSTQHPRQTDCARLVVTSSPHQSSFTSSGLRTEGLKSCASDKIPLGQQMSITRVGSPRRNIVAVMRSYIIAAVDVSETSIQRKGLSVTHFYIPFYPHGKHNKALKHDSRLTSHLPEPSLQTRCASRGSLVRYVCKSLNWSGGRQHAVSKTFYSYFDTEQVQASLFAKMPQWTAALQSAGFHISFSVFNGSAWFGPRCHPLDMGTSSANSSI